MQKLNARSKKAEKIDLSNKAPQDLTCECGTVVFNCSSDAVAVKCWKCTTKMTLDNDINLIDKFYTKKEKEEATTEKKVRKPRKKKEKMEVNLNNVSEILKKSKEKKAEKKKVKKEGIKLKVKKTKTKRKIKK